MGAGGGGALTSLADARVEGVGKHGPGLVRVLVLEQQLGAKQRSGQGARMEAGRVEGNEIRVEAE